jgi:hypothetical protein
MYNIEAKGVILKEEIIDKTPEELELYFKEIVTKQIMNEISKKINDFNFIDFEPSVDGTSFKYSADVILCSKQQVDSSIEAVVTNMFEHDLTETEIQRILEPFGTDMKGF